MSIARDYAYRDRVENLRVVSTIDASMQPCRFMPARPDSIRPLLVVLHTWMGSVHQNLDRYLQIADGLGWHALIPHFRGPNTHPEACGSEQAIQDVIDAIQHVLLSQAIDRERIYVVGGSGGGHMAMLLAARHPQQFTAVSAWCGISDLVAWHRETQGNERFCDYAKAIEQCVGGAPGSSRPVDEQLQRRSPLSQLTTAAHLPLDIAAGVQDGKSGAVPFWHSIWAYNVLAEANGDSLVPEEEIRQLWEHGRLRQPQNEDELTDPAYEGRRIYLRRTSYRARITIFEGGHEVIPGAACCWLSQYARQGRDVVRLTPQSNRPIRTSEPSAPSGSLDLEG